MKLWSFTPRMTELVIKNGCHTHINAEKWSGENLTNLNACYGHVLILWCDLCLQCIFILLIIMMYNNYYT